MTTAPVPIKRRVIGSLQTVWRRIPEPARHRFWTTVRPAAEFYSFQRLARPGPIPPRSANAPLVVAGLFSTASGLGEGARSTWRALQSAGLSPIAVDLSERFAPVDYTPDIPLQPMPDSAEGTLILQMNAPETPAALRRLGMGRGRRWYTVGYWAWELPTFPTGWQRAFPLLSEIWAVSTFTANAFRQHEDAPPISVFGHAITPPQNIRINREQFQLPEDAFVFVTFADSMSSIERKNPMAAIEAHKRAFGDDPSRILIVKTRNLDRAPKARTHLETAIEEASNIRLLDRSLSETERWELLQAVDVVVSLHRSEGFGLVIAEAMAIEKPVIATAWSGNMDFCTDATVWLVEAGLIETADPYGIYSSNTSEWAEIDMNQAVHAFRSVESEKILRAEKADLARDRIAHLAGQENVGKSMVEHLFRVMETS